MKLSIFTALLLTFTIAEASTYAVVTRNPAVIAKFKELNFCPATNIKATPGKPISYHCSGYVVDHGIPLCAGGKDALYNLRYQEEKDALIKDRDEVTLCNLLGAQDRQIKAYKDATNKPAISSSTVK